jgi:tRNA(Ile)-lysidine synthetase-like protein
MTVPEWGLAIDVSEQPAEGAGPFAQGVFQGDRQKVRFPLFVRRARAGDRIRPLGMGGHAKKLTRYLMDLKVPATERARQLVLAERDRVLWVVGRAVAEDCRIVPSTRSILRVRVTKMEGPIGEPTRA